MNDYIIMSGIAHHFSDLEVATIADLFSEDPVIAILEDGTCKDRRRADRRKATARKHLYLDRVISSKYPVKVHKHGRKDLRRAKYWYFEEDGRDLSRLILREAQQEAEYEERRSQFLRKVEAFLDNEERIDELWWLEDIDWDTVLINDIKRQSWPYEPFL